LNVQQCIHYVCSFGGHADKNHNYTVLTVTTFEGKHNADMALSENEFYNSATV